MKSDQVLEFLKSYYSKEQIINIDSTQIDTPDLEHQRDYFNNDALASSSSSSHESSDFMLMAIFVLVILTTFGIMYFFFSYLKRKPKLKKHII